MREVTQCWPEERIRQLINANAFAIRPDHSSLRIYVNGVDYLAIMDQLEYGDVFQVAAEITVGLGFLYPFEGGPSLTVRTTDVSFIDSAPEYYDLWWEHPFPADPGVVP